MAGRGPLKSELAAENAALRAALEAALFELRMIPQSRFDKLARTQGVKGDLDYRRGIEECDRLGRAAIGRIHDTLADSGIRL